MYATSELKKEKDVSPMLLPFLYPRSGVQAWVFRCFPGKLAWTHGFRFLIRSHGSVYVASRQRVGTGSAA